MDALRTPDECFDNLPGYDFAPNFLTIDDGEGGQLRVHYLDEGPAEAPPVLLMHGQPVWSYLYRKMIPGLVAAGHRVIVPDLVGFGKSDKPAQKSDYTYTRHVSWMQQVIDQLDLRDATLFGQDWGSLIGLVLAARNEDRITRIVIANGALPDPRKAERMAAAISKSPHPEAFARWQEFVAASDELDIPKLMQMAMGGAGETISDYRPPQLTDAEAQAYGAPFPDASFQCGPRIFPALVSPQGDDDPVYETVMAAWDVLERWEKPFLCLYGTGDPMLGTFDEVFLEFVPGTQGLEHQRFEGVGHFVQEEIPDELVAAINSLIEAT